MNSSNEFMLMFRFAPNFDRQPTPEELAEMQSQWGQYIGGLVAQEKLVNTHRLSFEGKKVTAALSVHDGVVMEENTTLSGNMVVRANSLDEATEIAKGSPILKAGGTVEVRSILPMG